LWFSVCVTGEGDQGETEKQFLLAAAVGA